MVGDLHAFCGAMVCFASGVTVVTTALVAAGQVIDGLLAPLLLCPLKPPLVLICLDRQTLYLQDFIAGSFAVNILTEDQESILIRFATDNSTDRWNGIAYNIWKTGAPILDGCLANIECDVELTHNGGNHCYIST